MQNYHTFLLLLFFTLDINAQDFSWLPVQDALSDQDFGLALKLMEDLPQSDRVLEKSAFCLYQLGEWKEAKATYEKILEADSLHLQSHLYLGTIYNQESNLPKAVLHFRHIVDLDSSNTYYLKSLAGVYERANLVRDAHATYQKVHQLNPRDISALLHLSSIWFDQKAYELADSFATMAYRLDTSNLQVILTKARCLYSLKRYGEAVTFFKRTKGQIDLSPFYQKMLGYAYLQVDSLDQAIFVLSNLLYQEQSEYTYSYLAKAYALKEDWSRAIEFYELAVEAGLSTNLEQYHLALAKLNEEHGKLKDVVIHFDEAFHYSGNPDYIFYKAQAAENYYKDKQVAVAQYQRYLQLSGTQARYGDFARDRIQILKEYIHQSR